VAVPKNEFKGIIQMMIELNALQKIHAAILTQNKALENIAIDKEKIIKLRESDIEALKGTINNIAPAWYDNFLMGFGSGIVILTALILLIK
jgi:hypothetical protein